MERVIEWVHTLIALIAAISSLVVSFCVLVRSINELLEEINKSIKKLKGGRFTMPRHVKKFLVVIVCFIIGTGILVIRAFTEPALRAPFDVTLFFYPSGWMGDIEHIQLNTGFRCNRPNDADGICIKITYRPGSKGWAGVYWQYPKNNWGEKAGRRITGARAIVFWAKGEKGGEIVEFKAGGISDPSKPYRDSFEVARRIRLTNNWVRYEMTLSGQDLSNVIGAFAWVASKDANPDGLTFYIDNITYE